MSYELHATNQIGNFTPKGTSNTIEYAENNTGMFKEFPHIIFVSKYAGKIRYARILKTVAYIVVDENSQGLPVIEKWNIKHHNVYTVSETRDNTYTGLLLN